VEADISTRLLARLAERGLTPKSFDQQVLTLHYDPEKDAHAQQGEAVNPETLARYARDVILGLPGADSLFPRLQDVVVVDSRKAAG
jgi:hypothetical protein